MTYPRCRRVRSSLQSKEVQTVPPGPAGHSGRRRRAGPAGQQAVPRCQPRSDGPSGILLSGHPRPSVPSVPAGVAWASATPAPGGRAARSQVVLGEALLPAQEDEENATFVSCSHLALAARGGGARGGRCGSAPPTGNF